MQLMPGTWSEMRAAHGLGLDPQAPRDNVLAGAAYLRLMYDRFGYRGLFAAYNTGPARYESSLHGRPLPRETIDYFAKVNAGRGSALAGTRSLQTPAKLYIPLRSARNDPQERASGPVSLFVTLRPANQ